MPNTTNDEKEVANITESKWNNGDNNAFYEELKAEGMQEFAENGGLASCCDMQILTPIWSKATSILEVGAGYGRVIDYLLKNNFQGKITAIERCNILFEHLEKKYAGYSNVNLIHADVRDLNGFKNQFDLILCMMSVIADFSPIEQNLIIKKLSKLLNENGNLIIDTIPASTMPLGSKKYGKQSYLLKINNFQINLYLPNKRDLTTHIKETYLKKIKYTKYQTDTGRERLLFILS